MQVTMMKRTLTVNIEDIKALELRCKCGAFISHPITTNLSETILCQNCKGVILQGDLANGKNISIHRLMGALSAWNDNPNKQCTITFTLESD